MGSHTTEIDGFNPSDPGIGLLRAAAGDPGECLLVHCGPVLPDGKRAVRVTLDVRERSVHGERCVADGLPATLGGPADPLAACGGRGRWPLALVWPRAHRGKDFSERCLALGSLALKPGGRLLCAVRKAKGAPSLRRVMERLLGNVRVVGRDRGYHLMASNNVSGVDEEAASAVLDRTYAFALDAEVELAAVPGVFSRRQLDRGTAALIAHLDQLDTRFPDGSGVLDLGAGVGPLSIWAARRWPTARVWAVESNLLAARLIEHNARAAGCADRVTVHAADVLAEPPAGTDGIGIGIGLVLSNPPTHAPSEVFDQFVTAPRAWLRAGGDAWYVVNRPGRLPAVLERAGAQVSTFAGEGYTFVQARWPA